MFNEINKSIDAAISSGAQYADARILISKSRDISSKDGELEDFSNSETKSSLWLVIWVSCLSLKAT